MSTNSVAKLLIVDDEAAQMTALCNTLTDQGYATTGFTSARQALAALREQEFDLLLTDLMMPDMDGIALLRAALEVDDNLVGIVMTGQGTIDTAVEAMKAGALDYILKPFKLSSMLPVLSRALSVRRLRLENIQLRETVGIHELSMAVAFTLDFDAILQKVADAAFQQSQAREVSILLPTRDGKELRVAVARGHNAERIQGRRVPISDALSGWVAHSRELLSKPDELTDVQPVFSPPLREITSGISIPMLTGGRLVGILNFTSARPQRHTTLGQVKALNILASAAASALEGASLLDQLRTAEQRYRRLAENAPDVVFRYGLQPRRHFDYVSPAVATVTGYSPEEYYADPELPFRIIRPEDQQLLEATFRGDFSSGGAVTLQCLHKNGTIIWIEQRSMCVQDVAGQLVAIEGIARDITERKRSEAALRDSEERYRNLFHSITDPLFVYDRKTLAYLAVNDAAVANYGYSRDEFLGMTMRDIRPPEDVPALLDMLARTGTTMENRGVWRHRKKNGDLIEVEISSYGVEFSGRSACVVQARDVTARQRAEAEVKRTTELLRAVADGTPDVVFVKDRNGKYLLFNEAASRYVGRSVSEVLGKDDAAIFGPEDARAIMASDRLVMESNQSQTVEELLATANGPRTFQSIKVPYRDERGSVIGVIGISRDITDRKQTEEVLRLRDRAIQAVSQGIVITNPNQPDNPIIYASAGFERITGYRAEEVLGKNCRMLQGADTDRETARTLSEAVADRRACMVEILNYRKDGRPFWNALSVNPVHDEMGGLRYFVGVQSDITARKKLEEQFRQAQKMEAVGQLAGGVAHDFNNLLTAIIGYSDIALNGLDESDSLRPNILEIKLAGERAATLTSQLLAFSRKQILQPRVLDLNEVVASMEKMLRRLIGEDIELATCCDPALGHVKADPGGIEQIILNLAVNARDAMPEGGKLTIETANVELDESYARAHVSVRPGAYVMLAVSDNGVGMSFKTQARIFEPFFTTKGEGRGTGLGLSTVYGMVKQSGGNIWVYSELGKGTTFKIYLPLVDDAVTLVNRSTPVDMSEHGSETILLVEDAEVVRKLVSTVLQEQGYEILVANHGSEALEISEGHPGPIHLLLTDVVMPKMTVRELVQRFGRLRPETRVVYVSGYTDDAIVHQGVLEEGVDFLQKPFTAAALLRKIREVLDQPRVS